MACERPEVVDERESLLRREMRDPRVETVAFEGARETKAIEASAAGVREEPLRARKPDGRALVTQHRAMLAYALRGAVLDDEWHRPPLRRRRGVGVGEIARLRELELEAPVGVAGADVDERVPRFFDPRVRDLRDVLARRFVERAPEIVSRGVRFRVPFQIDAHAFAERVLAEVTLDHAQHRSALRVRDRVEPLRRLFRALRL